MTDSLDVRDASTEDRRERLHDRLDRAAPGDVVTVVADVDPQPTLRQYGVLSDRTVTWAYDAEGPDDWTVDVTVGAAAEDAAGEGTVPEFDVRQMPPQRRHAVLTDTFDRLPPGDAFVLVNDHDPKPLYYELRSTHGDVIDWEYHSRDPDEWRVEIGRNAATAEGDRGGVTATFDVREIPKEDRHPTIHHRYGNLAAGESLAVVAPHEPKHLHQEFVERYGDAFAWTVTDQSPGRVRVRIDKQPVDEESGDAADAPEAVTELDVRDLPPAARHERIFESYDDLDEGEGFVLVNDHDPKPLYHQFDAEAGPEFYWEYRSREQGEFRVLVGRTEGDASAGDRDAVDDVEAPF